MRRITLVEMSINMEEKCFEHEWLGNTIYRVVKDDYRSPSEAKTAVLSVMDKCWQIELKPYNPSIKREYCRKTIELACRNLPSEQQEKIFRRLK